MFSSTYCQVGSWDDVLKFLTFQEQRENRKKLHRTMGLPFDGQTRSLELLQSYLKYLDNLKLTIIIKLT